MKQRNRLAQERSPYLLQHAENPVDWHPWGNEAFEKARVEDRPVFLSIGYSTCHWCHVMKRESVEDPEVAKLMNEAFVSIKVDREERPEIDNVYMVVCQLLTGGDGWPLTIIMTPDKRPFFAATYISKQAKFSRIGMLELIPQIQRLWVTQRADIARSAPEGGFYLTADDSESPLVRRKEIRDGAVPSGNAVAMLNLVRLGEMTADSDFEGKAARIAYTFSKSIKQSPSAHAQLMVALDAAVGPFYEVVIAGASQADDTKEMLKAIRRRFIPNRAILLRATEQVAPGIDAIAGFTSSYPSIDGRATVYVCTNHSCRLPSTDARAVLDLLDVR